MLINLVTVFGRCPLFVRCYFDQCADVLPCEHVAVIVCATLDPCGQGTYTLGSVYVSLIVLKPYPQQVISYQLCLWKLVLPQYVHVVGTTLVVWPIPHELQKYTNPVSLAVAGIAPHCPHLYIPPGHVVSVPPEQ